MLINSVHELARGVIIMLSLMLLASILKKFGLLSKSDSSVTSALVLKITLPAVIFSSLASHRIEADILMVSGIVAFSELICIVIAYLIARLLKFGRPETGALMLVSAFGMSTMLGYPLIREAFPGNITALQDAIVTSEIGVGLFLFISGPVIAMYFGENHVEGKAIRQSLNKFLLSPIFISIIAGIAVSFIGLPDKNEVIITISRLLKLIGNANLLLVAITIGLLLEIRNIKAHLTFLSIAIILKLVAQPLITYFLTESINVQDIARQVAFIETAMPSAILVALFAKKYNCKPELVSTTTLVTLIISLISVTLFFGILF